METRTIYEWERNIDENSNYLETDFMETRTIQKTEDWETYLMETMIIYEPARNHYLMETMTIYEQKTEKNIWWKLELCMNERETYVIETNISYERKRNIIIWWKLGLFMKRRKIII